MRAADTPLRHGYTLGQVEDLAKAAVNMAGVYASDYRDRLDAAYGAIVIHLYEAPRRPADYDLKRAGASAVHRMVESQLHLRGYRHRNSYEGAMSMPGFVVYWDQALTTPSPEPRIVEHVAIDQILGALSDDEREAVSALAVALATGGNQQTAAAMCGLPTSTFNDRINQARRRVFSLWHEWETPPASLFRTVRATRRPHNRPTHCPAGHEYTPENLCSTRTGSLRCKICVREQARARRAGQVAPRPALRPCGTYAAYWRHRRRGEPIDPACEAAAEEYKASRRKRNGPEGPAL